MKLKRNMEKMMSICLIEFPIVGFRRTQYITSIGLFYKDVGIYDIVVIFDFEVFLVGVCFSGGLLFYSSVPQSYFEDISY